jgi:hypothetical protein
MTKKHRNLTASQPAERTGVPRFGSSVADNEHGLDRGRGRRRDRSLTLSLVLRAQAALVATRKALSFSFAQTSLDFLGENIQRQQRLWADLLGAEVAAGKFDQHTNEELRLIGARGDFT